MKAIIVGASGLVGSHCLTYLLAAPEYQSVLSVGRKPLPIQHPKLQQLIIPLDQIPQNEERLIADHYFCCLGTTIKVAKTKVNFKKVDYEAPLALAEIAKAHNAIHFVIVTALGADARSSIFYNRVKGQLEEALIGLDLLHLTIVQPSLLLGDRKEFRLGERLFDLTQHLPIWFGPIKNYQPIAAQKVAKVMVQAAQNPGASVTRIESKHIHGH